MKKFFAADEKSIHGFGGIFGQLRRDDDGNSAIRQRAAPNADA